uniref:Si:ch211-59p23.1 n=1 Tax=Cyprinus carpio TaxID=7962 RepID=A0A8C1W9E9_CYPCA
MLLFRDLCQCVRKTTSMFDNVISVQATQDAVHQVAESSKETTSAAAEEASRQTQSAIGTAADKASDTIKEFGHKLSSK